MQTIERTWTADAATVYKMAEMTGTPRARRCNIYVDLAPLFAT